MGGQNDSKNQSKTSQNTRFGILQIAVYSNVY